MTSWLAPKYSAMLEVAMPSSHCLSKLRISGNLDFFIGSAKPRKAPKQWPRWLAKALLQGLLNISCGHFPLKPHKMPICAIYDFIEAFFAPPRITHRGAIAAVLANHFFSLMPCSSSTASMMSPRLQFRPCQRKRITCLCIFVSGSGLLNLQMPHIHSTGSCGSRAWGRV